MKKTLLALGLCFSFISTVSATPLSIGDAKADQGQLDLHGAIRSRYIYRDFANPSFEGSNNGQFTFNDLKLVLNYENPNWIGSMDVRFYQYDRLFDTIYLKDAWLAYKVSPQSKVAVGFQSADFGYARLWGNSNYETLANTLGLEDTQNLGVKYQYHDENYQLTLGFYPRDGGNYQGVSRDSSRYSNNFVTADDLTDGTDIEEKNMWVTRLSKTMKLNEDLKTEIGGSYWHSDLENNLSHRDGKRDAWTLFAMTDYQNWQWLISAGQQKIKNADDLHPLSSTIGSFDFPYQIANEGTLVANEISYSIKQPFPNIAEIKPYLTYSRFSKEQSDFLDTERYNAGLYFFYKNLGVQFEYILSKNDPATGGSANALAQGDSHRSNQLYFLALGYFF